MCTIPSPCAIQGSGEKIQTSFTRKSTVTRQGKSCYTKLMLTVTRPSFLCFLVAVCLLYGSLLFMPLRADAYPFGGDIRHIKGCYNQVIYVVLGPPKGGKFVWSFSTRTYQFGGPRRTGQWLLGLSGAPYYCIYDLGPPLTILNADRIFMMGSSQ
jgi:hypothetical protein